MEEKKNPYKFLMNEKAHQEGLDVDGRTLLKWI
jgi:hypothetical protein